MEATVNGGRVLHGGGGYLIGQANPQLHHPPHVITTEEARTNAALDAISRVLTVIGDDKSFTKFQQNVILEALNGAEGS